MYDKGKCHISLITSIIAAFIFFLILGVFGESQAAGLLKPVNGSFWISFFSVCFCLAFSAFYELIEWWVALLSGASAEAFLGTQGYVWDTQSDMALALLGSITSLMLLHGLHDRQINRIQNSCI